MFSAISGRYDLLNKILSFGCDRRWRRKAVESIPVRKGGIHLDLACGTGDVALEIVKQIEGATVVGADISLPMVGKALEKVRVFGKGANISFLTCAGESLPFRECSFDSVSIAFGIRNVVERERALREMVRVLKEGGNCLVLEFSLPGNSFLKKGYLFYFTKLLPFFGGLLSDKRAYRYLPDSVLDFPPREEFSRMMKSCGFSGVDTRKLTFGIVTLYVAEKKSPGI